MTAIFAYSYLRLSDEEFKRGESSSIQNQRTTIAQYCERNNITLLREFSDDGFSGGTFDRPGFNDMLRYLQKQEVTMVLTKDLSRLGRDMREASYYAETFFPDHGIHYIAIHDNFDSERDNTLAPFQFAMNDVYLRDTSKKVKTILAAKKKAGEYCACPPFGYKKDPRNKNLLVPDENTAPTVKLIFDLASQGDSTATICEKLNQRKIIPPLKYRVEYRDDFGDQGAARASDDWNYVTVKRILRNEVYLGHTLLGRTKKVSLKSQKKVRLDKNEWIITPNTHEPLVSQEQFDLAQRNLKERTTQWQGHEHVRKSIFGGIAYCAHCGTAMCSAGTVHKGERERYWYLQCNKLPKRSNPRCEHPGRIKYFDLVEIVTKELNAMIALTDEEIDNIIKNVQSAESNDLKQAQYKEQIRTLERRQNQIDAMVIKLYQDLVDGKLSDDRVDRMVKNLEEEAQKNKVTIEELESNIADGDQTANNYAKFFELIKKATHIETLTAEIVHTFIERIEISERILPEGVTIAGPRTPFKQEIRIFYRFIGEISDVPVREFNRDQKRR